MPAILHIERHFTATETLRDNVIGMSEGLTVLAGGFAADAAFPLARPIG